MPPEGAVRNSIRALPPLLVNQIAAGEVVERPASVVKELVENAIDAGATRITVELEQGGIELIRIADDGSGIPEDELALALSPHATSKISEAEDLDRIATMGFRGEALASIASVSRMSIRSRTREQHAAAEIECEGATIGPVRPASGPPGTVVTCRNLFFNTPARRKFLRTPTTEQTRCLDWLNDLAMANPSVGFTVTCDGKTRIDLPPDQEPRDRALDLLGRELEQQMLEAHADRFDDSRGMTIWGMVGLPTLARANQKAMHVFLNGRTIRDKTVQHAIREAYRGLMEPSRYPTVVLMLHVSPDAVDVNVHPQKLEVRFRDSSMVHSVVLRAVRDALRGADLTPTAQFRPSAPTDQQGLLPTDGGTSARFVEYFKRQVPEQTGGRLSYEALRDAIDRPVQVPAPSEPEHAASSDAPVAPARPAPLPTGSVPEDMDVPRPSGRLLQVHNSYVVTQDEQGVVIIDQHALHERAMFELLKGRLDRGPLESQRMLTPTVVDAAAQRVAAIDELAPLFERIGIEAQPMSPRSIGVFAFPTFLLERNVEPGEFMSELLDRSGEDDFVPSAEAALHEVLDMMACKAAVKAGDKLGEVELMALIELRDQIERSSNCPHGRPTSVRLTIRELERLFGRS